VKGSTVAERNDESAQLGVRREVRHTDTENVIAPRLVAAAAASAPQALAHRLLREFVEAHGFAMAQVWLPLEPKQMLSCGPLAHVSDPAFGDFRDASLLAKCPPGLGLPGRAFSSHEVTWLADMRGERGVGRSERLPDPAGTIGIAVPIVLHRQVVIVVEMLAGDSSLLRLVEGDQLQMELLPLALSLQTQEVRGALQRMSRRYAAATVDAADLALIVREDGMILDATHSSHVVGREGSLRGANLFHHVHDDDRLYVRGAIEASMGTAPRSMQFRVVTADGEVRYVDAAVKDLRDDPEIAGYVVNLRDITEENETKRLLIHDARHDPLTGLLNRPALLRHLDELINTQGRTDLAIAMCDMDGFTAVNDTLGHFAGDSLLRLIARRLEASVGDNDGSTLSRIEGDVFVAVFTGIHSEQDARDRVATLQSQMADAFTLGEAEIVVAMSVGYALLAGGMGPEALVWNADIAVREAKRLRCGSTVFTESLQTATRERRQLEHDLARAVAARQLRMVFQPVLDLATATIVGTEALLRWTHPERGEVSPASFVPIAEQIGLISEFGRFALDAALSQQRTWMDELGPLAPKFVAVNVSAVQLSEADFLDTVVEALRRNRVPAEALTLEITETALLADATQAAMVLNDLSDMGVGLDIDDFGTGYSSLAYLVALPVHALKIDRSFVWGLGDDPRMTTTVSALLALAKQLNLNVIAEGVETGEQLTWLREHGCQMIQGYFVSKPKEGREIPLLIRSQQTHSTIS
jgi:diguanylate cyclase (GGDEF)-like protein/PAS domain S-box-containing protein